MVFGKMTDIFYQTGHRGLAKGYSGGSKMGFLDGGINAFCILSETSTALSTSAQPK